MPVLPGIVEGIYRNQAVEVFGVRTEGFVGFSLAHESHPYPQESGLTASAELIRYALVHHFPE